MLLNSRHPTIYIDFSGSENLEIINRKLYFYLWIFLNI